MGLYTSQLVDVVEWSALQNCMELYRENADQIEVLTYPKIATLFTSETNHSVEYSLGLKKYQDRSTFLLTTIPPRDNKSIPLVVVDVKTDVSEEDGSCELRRTFFKNRGVDYILFIGADARSLKIQIHDKNNQEVTTAGIQGAFNNYQYECVMSFNPGKYTNYQEPITFMHEVSIDKIIGLDENIDLIRSEIIEEASTQGIDITPLGRNYFKNTSVDGLCCVGTPNAVPLFAIEYDGKDHGGIRDIAKNWIFKKAGIPLLRIKRIHYEPSKPDLSSYSEINKKITIYLLDQLLQADNYIARLLAHLKIEAANLDSNVKVHANIQTLTNRLDEYVTRRKDVFDDLQQSHTELADLYQESKARLMWWEDQVYTDMDREFEESEEESRWFDALGAVPELKRIQRSHGIVWQALFKPTSDERNEGLNITCVECGPYNVIDATGQFEFGEIISNTLLRGLMNKLDGIFRSGHPSLKDKLHALKDKLHALSYRRRWAKISKNRRIYTYIRWGSRYWTSLGIYFFGVVPESGSDNDISGPDIELRRIEDEVRDPIRNLPKEEVDEFITEMRRIHGKLVREKVGKFVLSEDYFNSKHLIPGCVYGKEKICGRRFLELLDTPDELRKLWFENVRR